MANLVDQIEHYIKALMKENQEGILEMKRNDIAMVFGCVPSQINYVLQTRFSEKQGYLVESRRGGGGYLRIVKLNLDPKQDLARFFSDKIGRAIPQETGERLIQRLREEGLISKRESILICSAVRREVLQGGTEDRDALRARILKTVLYNLLRGDI